MKSIFSKIIDKEVPCYLVAENEYAIAFMDINPVMLGHILVVPKSQVDELFDLDQVAYNELWVFTRLIASALKKTISCNRIGVSVIGFEVPHAHIHLIPINNMSDMNFANKISISDSELKNISQKIANNI